MTTWPRVYRVLQDYEPLGAKAGDHLFYDLREPNPVRLVRLMEDHGRMLGAEMDGVIEPCDGAPMPSDGVHSARSPRVAQSQSRSRLTVLK